MIDARDKLTGLIRRAGEDETEAEQGYLWQQAQLRDTTLPRARYILEQQQAILPQTPFNRGVLRATTEYVHAGETRAEEPEPEIAEASVDAAGDARTEGGLSRKAPNPLTEAGEPDPEAETKAADADTGRAANAAQVTGDRVEEAFGAKGLLQPSPDFPNATAKGVPGLPATARRRTGQAGRTNPRRTS